MGEYTQITLEQWVQWKEEIREKLSETVGNFVYIGYRLKQIRDSGMYGGAADIFGFAEKEYGLGKSTVSRFIAINEKYSEGGNSLKLKEEFKRFSSSKLSEMLTLPDSEIALITERTTVREIRELKDFNAREEQEYPQEEIPGQTSFADYPGVIPGTGEGKPGTFENPGTEAGGTAKSQGTEADRQEPGNRHFTPLEKCLADFFREKKKTLYAVMRYLEEEPADYREAAEQMNPSGQTSHRKGIIFLFLYGWEAGVKYRQMGHPEPVSLSWPELLEKVRGIYRDYREPGFWEKFYENPVATSQREEPKPEEATPEKGSGEEPSGRTTEKAEEAPEEKPEEKPEEDTAENMEGETVGNSCGTLQNQGTEPFGGTPDREEQKSVATSQQEKPERDGISGGDCRESVPEAEKEEIPGTGIQEIREDGDGENSRAAGLTGGAGEGLPAAGIQRESRETDAETDGDPAGEPDAGIGTAEGGGRTEDPETAGLTDEEIEEEIWYEFVDAMDSLDRFRRFYRWKNLKYLDAEELKEAYRTAVDLAASLEKLLIAKGGQP
ncbi:MAG: hypothetical protein NC541_15320 [bacterium]|nr:hypothetical protein [bacterium]